jgi:hypothetical protein
MDRVTISQRQAATRWVTWMMAAMWGLFFAAPTQAQTITATPNPLTFATAVPQGGASTAQSVTVRNTGNRTMNISAVSVSGSNATSFTFANNCGRNLNAGRTCTISVTFRPKATGALTAMLDVSNNATNAVAGVTRVTLNGTGAAPLPVLSVTPTSLAFGSVGLTTTSGPRAVVVSNTGQGVLTFTQAPSILTQTAGAGFAVSNTTTCGASLAPSASCIINVTFTPTTTGAKTGTLAIRTNGSPATRNVSLTGTGTTPTPVLALAPTRATLTCSTPYGGPVFTSIAAANTGTALVTLGAINFTGTGAAYFSQTNSCGGSIAAGSACSIAVKFTPTGRTQRTATMTVNSNGGNRTVRLTGTCRSHPSP